MGRKTAAKTSTENLRKAIKRGNVYVLVDVEPRIERLFLAEERRANGDDSSEFVIAILTNEETESAAYARAETIAEKYDAEIIAKHDGEEYYRVVRE